MTSGETATDTFYYSIRFNNGVIQTASVSITIVGTNDAPVVQGPVLGEVAGDGAPLTLFALANATDPEGDTLAVINVSGDLPPGVTWDAESLSFVLDPGDLAYQGLGIGEVMVIRVDYSISDGPASTLASVQWTIAGADEFNLILGTSGEDLITGTEANDHIIGGGGFDGLSGLGGNDLIELSDGEGGVAFGGAGNDIIFGGDGVSLRNVLWGGSGDDVLIGGSATLFAENVFFPGPGSDTILSGTSDGASAYNLINFALGDLDPTDRIDVTGPTILSLDASFGSGVFLLAGDWLINGQHHDIRGVTVLSVLGTSGQDYITLEGSETEVQTFIIHGGLGDDLMSGSPTGQPITT